MTGDHPTDWPTRHVKAQALREAAAGFNAAPPRMFGPLDAARVHDWLNERADEIEQS
jgi:hypothetical protein